MADMKRFLEQDTNTGAIVLTMKASNVLDKEFVVYVPEYIFCVVGYDGRELYSLGNYAGIEFHEDGTNGFLLQSYDFEILEYFYDRGNRTLVLKEIHEE